MSATLGQLELTVLLAVARLGDDAYGLGIRRDVSARTGRDYSIGAVYTTLQRLQADARRRRSTPDRRRAVRLAGANPDFHDGLRDRGDRGPPHRNRLVLSTTPARARLPRPNIGHDAAGGSCRWLYRRLAECTGA